MINKDKLQEALVEYKKVFKTHWVDEKFKWEAVKCFQDNWNPQASNFSQMFYAATAETSNLLTSGYCYPRQMIKQYAEVESDFVKQMFNELFN